MSQLTKKIRASISGVSPRDLIYPGIVLFFFIIVGILFFLATQFIAKNINNAFLGDTETEPNTLNVANYTLVANKLGISAIPQKNTISTPSAVSSTTTKKTSVTQVSNVSDINSLTINILNSTTKKGVASALAQSLESLGYARATTGNEKKLYATTTIIIKENRSSFGPALLEEVKKFYSEVTMATTTEVANLDVTVIIGTH